LLATTVLGWTIGLRLRKLGRERQQREQSRGKNAQLLQGYLFTKSLFNISDHPDAVEINLRRIGLARSLRISSQSTARKYLPILSGREQVGRNQDLITVTATRPATFNTLEDEEVG
jgi:hypothetical protein